jgi:hypothetical protein
VRNSLTFAPSTFEERGVAVPFTTSQLNQGRVRRNPREKLELFLPGFTGGPGQLVVPWRGLPDIVTMTVHDRKLYQAIEQGELCTPEEIRQAAMTVAATGLAGPLPAKAARLGLEELKDYQIATNFLMVLQVLAALGLSVGHLVEVGLDTAEGARRTRTALAEASTKLGITAEKLYGRILALARMTVHIGIARAPRPGRLRLLLEQMQAYRGSLAEWCAATRSEDAAIGEFCVQVADHTIELAMLTLGSFDAASADICGVLADWDQRISEIQRLAARLAWLLDGWEYLVLIWDAAKNKEAHEQSLRIGEMLLYLPIIPRNEAGAAKALANEAALANIGGRRSARSFEDWRTGELDVVLSQRIEDIKTKSF